MIEKEHYFNNCAFFCLDKNSLCDGLVNFIKQQLNKLLGLVEVNGIEPMTSCLQSRRSPN